MRCPRIDTDELGDVLAEVTVYYHWGPDAAWALTPRRLFWWYKQAIRIEKKAAAT